MTDTEYMDTTTRIYSEGSEVVTRRGKTGFVKANLPNGMILVAFSPTHAGFEMKETAVVSASAYRSMQAGSRINASNQRYNCR
jgi:hypothetical protein